jgi:hypothetical protein
MCAAHLLASGEEYYGALFQMGFDEKPQKVQLSVQLTVDIKLL